MPQGRAGRVPVASNVSYSPLATVLPGKVAALPNRRFRDVMRFTTIVVCSCLLLQRFSLPAGEKAISVVGFIGLGAVVVGLARNSLTLDRTRFRAFLLLCMLTVFGMCYNQVFANRFLVPPSLQSLLQFLLFSSFMTVSFAEPISEEVFFRRVADLLGIVAIAGILQFLAQLVGLGLFSFRGLVPPALLFEDGWNPQIPAGFGGVYKSNGFFLLEPSIMSQVMVVALMIEILALRRPRYLALFTAGLLLSFSGTGWIVFATFVLTIALSMGIRGVLLAGGTLSVVAVMAFALSFLAPDAVASMTGRLDEVFLPMTSGHLRFVTPFWVMSDVLRLSPDVAWMGLGGGVSERLMLPYDYNVNTPVKIILEYGLPSLLAYLVLLVGGHKTTRQRVLVAPCLVLLMFTGGYQQFPPMLFLVLLIISVARLQPAQTPTRAATAA